MKISHVGAIESRARRTDREIMGKKRTSPIVDIAATAPCGKKYSLNRRITIVVKTIMVMMSPSSHIHQNSPREARPVNLNVFLK